MHGVGPFIDSSWSYGAWNMNARKNSAARKKPDAIILNLLLELRIGKPCGNLHEGA